MEQHCIVIYICIFRFNKPRVIVTVQILQLHLLSYVQK